jgi:hypothetical protein
MERETGFEPATSTLARLHSTTELFPPLYEAAEGYYPNRGKNSTQILRQDSVESGSLKLLEGIAEKLRFVAEH